MQGRERNKGIVSPRWDYRSLGQGSREWAWNGEGQAGSGILSF